MSKKDDRTGSVSRRTLIKMGIVTGIAAPMPVLSQPPNRMRPQLGDVMIFEDIKMQNLLGLNSLMRGLNLSIN